MEHQPYQPTEPETPPEGLGPEGAPDGTRPPPDPPARPPSMGLPSDETVPPPAAENCPWDEPAADRPPPTGDDPPDELRPVGESGDGRAAARDAGDDTGLYPHSEPMFAPGARFDWGILEQLDDDPEPEPSRQPWRMITAASLLTALLTAAAGGLLLWGAGAFDPPPPAAVPETASANYTLVQSPARPAIGETGPAAGELADLTLEDEDRYETDGPPAAPIPAATTTTNPVNTVAEVAEQVIPSIVAVYNYAAEDDIDPSSSGSGVIFNSDGHLLTNHHVIDGAAALRVILHNGRSLPASVVGSDPLMDIAVLKVEWPDLRPVGFADIATARIGDPTVAIGNPLGLDGGPSVTSGVISAFDRTLLVDPYTGAQLYGLLQTDTPITRGSSGGALLNRQGRLLGITSAIGLSDVGAEGIGFAVPINLVTGIIDDLLADGEVRHAYLGIEGSPAFNEDDFGVKTPIGVEVNRLLDGSGFGAGGGQAGDVITALDDQSVVSMTLLVARLRGYRADDPVRVSVLREGDDMELSVTLGLYPQPDDS